MTATTSTRQRWLGAGQSIDPDSAAAGREATREAMTGEDAKLLIVFSSDAYDLPVLLASINETSGGVPLIGCSTAGEIAGSRAGDASVVVMALGGPGFSIATGAGVGASARLREAGAQAASCFADVPAGEHRVLILLSDALRGDQQEVVRGAYGVLGAEIPLVGGCAGDGLKMERTFQFLGTEVLEDAVVGAALVSDAPIGIGVRHGWRKVGEPMMVTGSWDNRVYTLDDRPALDVYLERLDAPAEARTDPAAFTKFAITHPLGINRRTGEEVRFVAEANFEDRSLGCVAHVPQGGLTWFMEGDDQSVLGAADGACFDALKFLDERPPLGFVAFDCVARRGVLGDGGVAREVSRIGELAGGAPVAGFYSYGEIARTHGINGFHNQTLVILAIS